jgi:hypothetical protein
MKQVSERCATPQQQRLFFLSSPTRTFREAVIRVSQFPRVHHQKFAPMASARMTRKAARKPVDEQRPVGRCRFIIALDARAPALTPQ